METQNTQSQTASALQGYEDKIAAHIRAANARIDEFEATAKPKRAQAEIAAINGLKVARQNIERMLVDLAKTRDTQLQTRQGRHRHSDRGTPVVARGVPAEVHDTVRKEVTSGMT